jgi:hypothetical protein
METNKIINQLKDKLGAITREYNRANKIIDDLLAEKQFILKSKERLIKKLEDYIVWQRDYIKWLYIQLG